MNRIIAVILPLIAALLFSPATRAQFPPADRHCHLGSVWTFHFTGSLTTLDMRTKDSLDVAAATVKMYPNCRLVVEGYGVAVGNGAGTLAWDRVSAVIDYLIKKQQLSTDRFVAGFASLIQDPSVVILRGADPEGLDQMPAPNPDMRAHRERPSEGSSGDSVPNGMVVYQTDFGLKDGAVSEMKGVAMAVSPGLKLFDLTHEIPAYNIWEAAYRLQQTVPYWPKGTVFASIVDPGVGTSRKSVVMQTKTGQYIVTPDNGTLTLVAESLGIAAVREIDEKVNRRPGSEDSYTFHGRDVYSYTAARLAAGVISFEQVGPLLHDVVRIPYQHAAFDGKILRGAIPILDVQYGNVWTNIPSGLFSKLNVSFGQMLHLTIFHQGTEIWHGDIPYSQTFGAVPPGKPLAYLNSLMQLAFALNQDDFAKAHHIGSGADWSVEVSADHAH